MIPFAEDDPAEDADGQFVLDIDGFDGPIDVLLSLARSQKLDLRRVSILALVDQYLGFVARARRLRLELAADYLVMAAWLAYLKSRLLLPEPAGPEEPSAEDLAQQLAQQLERLEALRRCRDKLFARARRGRDWFARGHEPALDAPEPEAEPAYAVTLDALVAAYAEQLNRRQPVRYRVEPMALHSVEAAIERLTRLLGRMPGWATLETFLPLGLADPLGDVVGRSAIAATFGATLELARRGVVQLRQEAPFAPLYVRAGPAGEGGDHAEP